MNAHVQDVWTLKGHGTYGRGHGGENPIIPEELTKTQGVQIVGSGHQNPQIGMPPTRIIHQFYRQNPSFFSSPSCHFSLAQHRSVSTTLPVRGSWMDTVKGVFTGKKSSPEDAKVTAQSFTLIDFADQLSKARKLGTFKQYMVGRSSEATFADAFEKQEAILRYLGGCDPTGENLQTNLKQEAAKQCSCTIADVENALAKFTWAKEAHKKLEKLKEEGKPMPKSMAEVQKIMGSTPYDLAKSNLAKSGQISRNALCPCGSKKRYKRCCGKD